MDVSAFIHKIKESEEFKVFEEEAAVGNVTANVVGYQTPKVFSANEDDFEQHNKETAEVYGYKLVPKTKKRNYESVYKQTMRLLTDASYIASLVVVIVLPFQIVDLNAVIDTARWTNPVGQPWRVLLATCGAFFQNQTTTFNCERLAFSRSAIAAIKESNSASVSSVAFLLELIVTEGGTIRFVA